MTAEHMASCQNKKPCAPEQQKQDSPHRDRDSTPSPKERHQATWGGGFPCLRRKSSIDDRSRTSRAGTQLLSSGP